MPPLSNPTAFEREGDFKCSHEPFSAPFYLGPNPLSSRCAHHKPSSFHETDAATSPLRTRGAKISSEAPGRWIFVKDIAAHIVSSLDGSILHNSQFLHQLLYNFLIRSLRNDRHLFSVLGPCCKRHRLALIRFSGSGLSACSRVFSSTIGEVGALNRQPLLGTLIQ